MRVKILAVEPVDYDSKKHPGTHVQGTKLHYLRNLNEREKSKGIKGSQMPGSEFTRLDTTGIQPGNEYEFQYEMMGGQYPELAEIRKV